MSDVDEGSFVEGFGDLLADVDRACLDAAFAGFMAGSVRAAVTGPFGIAGWRDDDLAFIDEWGSTWRPRPGPRCGRAPTTGWFRSPTASGSPPRSRNATAHVLEGEGHLLVAIGRLDDILDSLMS